MSDDQDKDSKSEDPTEKKINDALEEGNVPVSRELSNVTSLFALGIIGYFYLPQFTVDMATILKGLIANSHDWPLGTGEDASNIIMSIGPKIMISLLPIVSILMIMGLLSAIVQNRPRVVLKRIHPKMQNVSLKKGLSKLFGKNGAKDFAKSILKFGSAGTIGMLVFLYQSEYVLSLVLVDSIKIPGNIHGLFLQVTFGLAVTLVTLGVADLIWARQEWFENQKMSHQDIKDERKQSEGDQIVKQRSISLARDRARKRMIDQVNQATLVIANPTHFAVAMRYDPSQDTVPMVLAKGQDLIALKIRSMAEEQEIPVIEDKPLARSLYKVVQIDKEIPPEFYVPIAKIIRLLAEKEKIRLH